MSTSDTAGPPQKEAGTVATVLHIDPAVGRRIREARLRRGWTLDDLTAELGRMGTHGKGLGRTQLGRIEQGRQNLTAEQAWRFIEIFDEPEFDAWEVLKAARIVPPDSSPRLRAAVLEEAESRRRGAGNDRRWDRQIAVAEVASGQGKRTTDQPGAWAGQRPALTIIPGEKDQGETRWKVA
jgi:transcriptional regulator with XRE-family HTH domain